MGRGTSDSVAALEGDGYARCGIDPCGAILENGGFLAWRKTLDEGVCTYLIPMRYGMTYARGETAFGNQVPTEWATGLWMDDRETGAQAGEFQSLPCFGTLSEALSFNTWAEKRYQEGEMHPGESDGHIDEAMHLLPTVDEMRDFWEAVLGDPARAENIERRHEIAHWKSRVCVTAEELGWPSSGASDVGLLAHIMPTGNVFGLPRGEGKFGISAKMSLEFLNSDVFNDMVHPLGSRYDCTVFFDNAADLLAFQKRMGENEEFAREFLIEHAPEYQQLPSDMRDFIEREPPEYVDAEPTHEVVHMMDERMR